MAFYIMSYNKRYKPTTTEDQIHSSEFNLDKMLFPLRIDPGLLQLGVSYLIITKSNYDNYSFVFDKYANKYIYSNKILDNMKFIKHTPLNNGIPILTFMQGDETIDIRVDNIKAVFNINEHLNNIPITDYIANEIQKSVENRKEEEAERIINEKIKKDAEEARKKAEEDRRRQLTEQDRRVVRRLIKFNDTMRNYIEVHPDLIDIAGTNDIDTINEKLQIDVLPDITEATPFYRKRAEPIEIRVINGDTRYFQQYNQTDYVNMYRIDNKIIKRFYFYPYHNSVKFALHHMYDEILNYYVISQKCPDYFCRFIGYKYDDVDLQLYIVMEDCGKDLFTIMEENSTTNNEWITIIAKIAEALICLYNNNYIHSDIKPDNIVAIKTDTDIIVKFIDAGFLTRLHENARDEHKQLSEEEKSKRRLRIPALGTPRYMHPDLKNLFYKGISVYSDFKLFKYDLYSFLLTIDELNKHLNLHFEIDLESYGKVGLTQFIQIQKQKINDTSVADYKARTINMLEYLRDSFNEYVRNRSSGGKRKRKTGKNKKSRRRRTKRKQIYQNPRLYFHQGIQ